MRPSVLDLFPVMGCKARAITLGLRLLLSDRPREARPPFASPRLLRLLSPSWDPVPLGAGRARPSFAVFCPVLGQKSGYGHFVSFVLLLFLMKGRKGAHNALLLKVLALIKRHLILLSVALKYPFFTLPEESSSL